ncbi:MAG: FecR domain-containing protein [Caulobacteraceae bacterium]|nr:FecR domain-containing protein [Caulobacteraceae bacterium]
MGTLRGDDRRTLEEAAAWFTRLNQESVSEALAEEFFQWRRTPAHRAAYAEVEARWRQADRVRNDPELVRLTETALRRPKARQVFWRRAAKALPQFGLATAVLAGAIALAVTLFAPQTYHTEVGAQQIVRLEDGSVLRLNTDSKVEVRFTRTERRLVLRRGEGFFEVAHDVARPFVVQVGDAEVRALGTRFDVRRAGPATQVVLLEGRVRVSRPTRDEQWTLTPNQKIVLNGARPSPASADAASATSWTTGRLRFHQTPLADAVAEVNRYNREQIALDAGPVGQVRVSGVFDTGDTRGFVSAVTELFDLRAEVTAGGVRLRAMDAPRAG